MARNLANNAAIGSMLAIVVAAGLCLAANGTAQAQTRGPEAIDFPPRGHETRGTGPGPRVDYGGGGTVSTGGRAIIVDRAGRGHYRTIQAALNAARSGATIAVQPSRDRTADSNIPYTYSENLRITKPVTLRSAIPGIPVIVQSGENRPCLSVSSNISGLVTVSNMQFIAPISGYRSEPCIDVRGSVFNLIDSEVVGTIHHPGIVISGGFSRIEGVRVHDSRAGIRIDTATDADYFISGNELFNNIDGLRIHGPARPKVLDNFIHNNLEHGVVIVGGGGSFVGNEISRNGGNGVYLQQNSPAVTVQFRANDIIENGGAGIRLRPNAAGEISSNRIFANSGGSIVGLDTSPGINVGLSSSLVADDPDLRRGRRGLFGNIFGGSWRVEHRY